MVFEDIIFSNPVITWLFFIIAYAILGGGVKYIDDAFDEGIFSKTSAILLAPLLGILWAFSMSLSAASATILMAIVLGVLVKGKIDNIAHKAGLISILGVLFISGYFNFLWVPLIIIAIAGIVDEVGNDFVDKNNVYNKQISIGKFTYYFFEYRFAMKLAVLAFALLGAYEWFYFFAFIAFDVAYALIMQFGASLVHKRKFYYDKSSNNGAAGLLNEASGTNEGLGRFT